MTTGSGDDQRDPRIYMAAERTFLAWMRTALALMAFGFVVARFGVFLREIAMQGDLAARQGSGPSLWVGLALIGVGVLTCVVSAVRHQRYVKAIDEGNFRRSFGSTFAFALVAVLALVGVAMALTLVRL
ncbi:MAG: YidH family protein [Thermoanaerobaculia bacterium]